MVPLPFGKAVLLFGEPICVPEDASPEEVEEIRLTLESEINRLEVDAERKLGYGVKRLKG